MFGERRDLSHRRYKSDKLDAIYRVSTREMAKLGTTRLIKVHSIGQPILAEPT
ncbi:MULTISPECIES: hypothetical protein [unclassified Nodularia (in: cyanobacteria)]|uniref:hypothetical protein n=1 Tax=unclassified Nodularia (in: cyanobacteria) TaxID=2656917 RepID=UPI001880BE46|nr:MULTISPECIES: hypothetical protein [unclassified Nodularia (in: cyanobacteria)]MBE9197557.1 hypothetical protein [Nodularia sp. LEGE 06071]MCC2693937.1 hypothetical protein [Nodularia sp. LEGE 04288]